jgi:hypothetical protein
MAVAPNEGRVVLVNNLLAGGTLEAWSLRLFKNDYTPVVGSVLADFTQADFTGYSAKTLTRSQTGSTWGAASIASNIAQSEYATDQSFTYTGATSQSVYGWYIVGATSGKVILAHRWTDGARVAVGDGQINVNDITFQMSNPA